MQNNNQPLYTLSSQTLTPTNSFYTIGGASPIMYSDHELSSVPTNNAAITTTTSAITPQGRSGKKIKVSKRKQVKNACTNCQKACKKCDEGRACQRCVKLGIADSCIDSPRKERLKGVKRGPYKKRQRENVTSDMNQFHLKGQDTPFYYERALVWDNAAPTIQQQQQRNHYQQPHYHQQQQQQPHHHYHHQRQTSSSSLSSDFLFAQEQVMPSTTSPTNGYYSSSPSVNQHYYSQSPIHGTPSPLSNSLTDHYASPMTSSLSASPTSSIMPLPQDTLESILSVDDMTLLSLQVPIKQEPLYDDDLMMLPLQDPAPSSPTTSASFAWSTPSPTNASFAPHLTQAIYHQQQYIPHQHQQKEQLPMYWDQSTYDWSSVCAPQPYM